MINSVQYMNSSLRQDDNLQRINLSGVTGLIQ